MFLLPARAEFYRGKISIITWLVGDQQVCQTASTNKAWPFSTHVSPDILLIMIIHPNLYYSLFD